MKGRSVLSILTLALAVACNDSTTPARYGALKQRVVHGRVQSVVAGTKAAPQPAIDEVYREQLASVPDSSAAARAFAWLFVPRIAYAQTSVNIQLQPNVTVCVENPTPIDPLHDCVMTDSIGQSRFDFPNLPTTAGAYVVKFGATKGVEVATFDSVTITVSPASPDPNYSVGSLPLQSSPAVFPANGVRDIYGNAIPYRIVGDARLTVSDTTLGSVGARTVTWSNVTSGQFYTLELRGQGDVLVGRIRYRVQSADQKIDWTAFGTAITP